MKKRTILIVEDDEKISNLIKLYLEKEGFNTSAAFDGEEGLRKAINDKPDFIIMDLMLPYRDGIEITKEIRLQSDVPILMLSAKSDEFDKVFGLEIGADDYLTKPFSPKELIARVKAIFRRINSKDRAVNSEVLKIKDIVIDRNKFQIKKQNNIIYLSPLEFKIVYLLASYQGQVFTRDQIMKKIYDYNEIVYDRTIDVHIKNIRKKLEDNPKKPVYIESIFGVGYKFKE